MKFTDIAARPGSCHSCGGAIRVGDVIVCSHRGSTPVAAHTGCDPDFAVGESDPPEKITLLVEIGLPATEAHARLVAAAPELLSALKAMNLECLFDHLNPYWDNRPSDKPGLHWGSEEGAPIEACSACNARAAIAKAECLPCP